MHLCGYTEFKSRHCFAISATQGPFGLCLAFLLAVAAFAQIASAAPAASPPAASSKDLKIYFVDVEGGQATLFVTPAGQSLLIDTGWPDNNFRDADRIVAAAKNAGITKIDYVLITHFHEDHVGGAPQLAERIPIGTFIDHGENRETTDAPTVKDYQAYQQLLASGKYKHIVAKPGDVLPIEGIHATAVSADAVAISTPLRGGGAENSACKDSPKYPEDKTENRRSLGTVIDFGKLRIVDLGDLTHDEEIELMCPMNKLGHADILVVSHHGWDQSSSPALVWGLAPRVAIMDNGAKKGGSPSVWDIIEKSPGLENLWQVHFSDEAAPRTTSPLNSSPIPTVPTPQIIWNSPRTPTAASPSSIPARTKRNRMLQHKNRLRRGVDEKHKDVYVHSLRCGLDTVPDARSKYRAHNGAAGSRPVPVGQQQHPDHGQGFP